MSATQITKETRHDVRNKLSTIRNATSYLRRRVAETALADDVTVQQFLRVVEEEAAAVARLLDPRDPAPISPSTRAAARLRPFRVLLAEDDDGNRETLAALLEEEGFEVVAARSRAEALAMLDAIDADDATLHLAVVDHDLGDGGVLDLLPTLRANFPRARVILTSGSPPGHDLAALCDAVFLKGDDADQLLDLARTLCL